MSYKPRHLVHLEGDGVYKFTMTMGTRAAAEELRGALLNVDESVRPFFTALPLAGNRVICTVPTAIAPETLEMTLRRLDVAVTRCLANSVQPVQALAIA